MPLEPRGCGCEPWHGTHGGYTNHDCRCDRCRGAHAAAHREWRERRIQEIRGGEPWHGTYGGYTNHGCRCNACRRANTEYARNYHRRRAGILSRDMNGVPAAVSAPRDRPNPNRRSDDAEE